MTFEVACSNRGKTMDTDFSSMPDRWREPVVRPPEIVSMNDEIRQLIESGKIVTAQ